MRSTKMKFLKVVFNKWRKIDGGTCSIWALWRSRRQEEENFIPRDVPKGHLVVYVGEECKRFVIKITLLDHPLFKALLDKAREEYDFTAESKLCIPCDEDVFLGVVSCAKSSQNLKHSSSSSSFFFEGSSTEALHQHLIMSF